MKFISFAALFLGVTSVCSANLVLNGDFENSTPLQSGVQVMGTGDIADLTNWKVIGTVCGANCVLILNTTYSEGSNVGTLLFQAQSGNQSLDLTGGGNTSDGGIEQAISTAIGTTYQLTFYVGNMDNRASFYAQSSSVEVKLNGASQGLFTNNLNTNGQVNWALETLNFTATSTTTTIDFINATTGDNYAGLDNVAVNAVSSVPEPSTLAFSMLVACCWSLRRLVAHR
jgi:hypothetical protein